jgi:hypothetical protein
MTKVELLTQLRELNNDEPECSHAKADRLLIEFIDDAEVEHAFNSLTRWYA